jgi:hypothetical protein
VIDTHAHQLPGAGDQQVEERRRAEHYHARQQHLAAPDQSDRMPAGMSPRSPSPSRRRR